jgi:predicted component of type VI protein secretion system
MHVQEQEVRKNYIGIVCDRTEEQRAIASVSHSTLLMRDSVRGLMAALFNRRNNTTWAFRARPRRLPKCKTGYLSFPDTSHRRFTDHPIPVPTILQQAETNIGRFGEGSA